MKPSLGVNKPHVNGILAWPQHRNHSRRVRNACCVSLRATEPVDVAESTSSAQAEFNQAVGSAKATQGAAARHPRCASVRRGGALLLQLRTPTRCRRRHDTRTRAGGCSPSQSSSRSSMHRGLPRRRLRSDRRGLAASDPMHFVVIVRAQCMLCCVPLPAPEQVNPAESESAH
jgi:hypothetical protein